MRFTMKAEDEIDTGLRTLGDPPDAGTLAVLVENVLSQVTQPRQRSKATRHSSSRGWERTVPHTFGSQRKQPQSSHVHLVAEEHALEHGARRDNSRLGSGRQPQQVQLFDKEAQIGQRPGGFIRQARSCRG